MLSEGFQIETELSIHAVDHRWRIKDVPIEYRDRPEGSESKLNTVSDGIKVVAMIGTLFKDYRPLKFFSLVALLFAVFGLALGMPIVVEYFQTGLVPRFPTAMLAASFMFLCGLSLATGFILDSVAKVEKAVGGQRVQQIRLRRPARPPYFHAKREVDLPQNTIGTTAQIATNKKSRR